ncbi:hypothetical protein H5T51_05145 [Candidatus Bathyarchaeota archaeon]|nr:hypothetical protein [Candidatus Bathyarchaeota archaeon]
MILFINLAFPPYFSEEVSYGELEWRDVSNIIDLNSTFYKWEGAYANVRSQEDWPVQPQGWFELTVRIPFEICENWSRINILTTFSTGTYGGVNYSWTLSWRIYNDTYIALSDKWDHLFLVSADTPASKSADFPIYISREQENSSVYTSGKWFYEAVLTVHHAKHFGKSTHYINHYQLSTEIIQETEAKQTTPSKSLYTSVIAATAMIISAACVLKRKNKHS